MNRETTRRALLGAVVAGATATAGLTSANGMLSQFAPASGSAWESAKRRVPDTIESSHGAASVTYDDDHVPHIEADDEEAAYFAVGYTQAADRLFEMDLFRRRMRGTLSAAVGEQTVESDVFHAKMDFLGGARASARALEGTPTERMTEAFADGVNAYIETGPLPLEFGLLDYEPKGWTVVDSLLVGAQVSWGLTGSFNTLRRAILRETLGTERYNELYPPQLDHDYPIIREGQTRGEIHGMATEGTNERLRAIDSTGIASARVGDAVDAGLMNWLTEHEPPPFLGSNSWVVSGEHAESGKPIVCNDPHLILMVPPVWYEQHVNAGDVNVRGVSFPGIPFVIIGENDHGAWGFTNTGADVVDLYTYRTNDDRTQYRYDGEWREMDSEKRTVEVAGGKNRTVEVKQTVHGAFIDREIAGETQHVGVAWTGMTETRESAAIYEFSKSTNMQEFKTALEKFDVPTQNAVYADRDGNTLYYTTGKIPIRTVDGEVVRGDRVFDGSTGEAEWEGFTAFDESSWEGFIPFDEKPGVINPDYIGTANQRLLDDPKYPIGQEHASPFRGQRVYERLDQAIARGTTIDREFMKSLQRDSVDIRARMLVPAILDARDEMSADVRARADELEQWEFHMKRDSKAALVFAHFYDAFRELTWADDYEEMGLEDSFWPQDWTLVTLPADHEFFGGDRATVIAQAMKKAVETIEEAGWETYGDYNRTAIDHPFGGQVGALNYPRYPTDGSPFTVMNFRKEDGGGSSWRMVAPMGDAESVGVMPGGQDGSYFSSHYHDQLKLWADGDYREIPRTMPSGDADFTFEEGDG